MAIGPSRSTRNLASSSCDMMRGYSLVCRRLYTRGEPSWKEGKGKAHPAFRGVGVTSSSISAPSNALPRFRTFMNELKEPQVKRQFLLRTPYAQHRLMEDRQDSRKSLPDGLSAHRNLMAQQQRLPPLHGSNWRLKSRNQKRLRPSCPFSIGRYCPYAAGAKTSTATKSPRLMGQEW